MIAHLLERKSNLSGHSYHGLVENVWIDAWVQSEPSDDDDVDFGYGFGASLGGIQWARSERGEFETRDDAVRALFEAIPSAIDEWWSRPAGAKHYAREAAQ